LLHKWKISKLESRASKEVWEEDYELLDNEGMFEEYLEMGRLFSVAIFAFDGVLDGYVLPV